MQQRSTFTLGEEAANFIATKENRSAYINQLILNDKAKELKAAIIKANIEEAEDQKYQEELALWDVTLMDGLE